MFFLEKYNVYAYVSATVDYINDRYLCNEFDDGVKIWNVGKCVIFMNI